MTRELKLQVKTYLKELGYKVYLKDIKSIRFNYKGNEGCNKYHNIFAIKKYRVVLSNKKVIEFIVENDDKIYEI